MALAITRTLSEHLKSTGEVCPLDSFVIRFGDEEVEVKLVSRTKNQIRLAIKASEQVKIVRSELIL